MKTFLRATRAKKIFLRSAPIKKICKKYYSFFFVGICPRPLLVSGSPFLPPLSRRASLLKIRLPRPPWETPKFFRFSFIVVFSRFFFDFLQEYIASWKLNDFPKTPRRYTNFLEMENLMQNEYFLCASPGKKRKHIKNANFLRASRGKKENTL